MGEQFPQQNRAADRRASLNMSGSVQKSLVLCEQQIPVISQAAAEQALVVLIGVETGPGKYKGSILNGNSTEGTSTLANEFQLQASPTQNASFNDGPAATLSGASYVNNALVINLAEAYIANSHLLYSNQAYLHYTIGRIMGQTNEATPRTIVYVNEFPHYPVLAKITGAYPGASAKGCYTGRIVQGQFGSGSNFGYADVLSDLNSAFLPGSDDCLITNLWEQANNTSGLTQLANGTYVIGLMTGLPAGIVVGGVGTAGLMYQVYTMLPPQAASIGTVAAITTTQTASGSYASNEQTMLANLKADVNNLRAEVAALKANLGAAGYGT